MSRGLFWAVLFVSNMTFAKSLGVAVNAMGIFTGQADLGVDYKLNDQVSVGLILGEYTGVFLDNIFDSVSGTGYGLRANYRLKGSALVDTGFEITGRIKYYPEIRVEELPLLGNERVGTYSSTNIFAGVGFVTVLNFFSFKVFGGVEYWTNDEKVETLDGTSFVDASESGFSFELECLLGLAF